MADEERKTWQEWNDLLDTNILDPDGFLNRTNSYTLHEFTERLGQCTVLAVPKLRADSLARAMAKELSFMRAPHEEWLRAANGIIKKMREEQQQ